MKIIPTLEEQIRTQLNQKYNRKLTKLIANYQRDAFIEGLNSSIDAIKKAYQESISHVR